ncbi:hypothetical protein O181_022072 [Austropuccinia psidii MF-1]|uniref:Reverse transcriptase/retrotransposon-derived protein RNase H-like domain-containing protein n=1 Tax=Austropuccinia psidii MF-1 TaxID=1389203 RepID=A0A9Q3CGR9_9BASI|nr:hypothetical protein [Austropuccinia psidii MF-1]
MTVERVKAFESFRQAFRTAPLLLMTDFNNPYKLHMNASGDGLGSALCHLQILNDKTVEGPICFISRKIKPTEARYVSQPWKSTLFDPNMAYPCHIQYMEIWPYP